MGQLGKPESKQQFLRNITLCAVLATCLNGNACNDQLLFKARDYERNEDYATARAVYWVASYWPKQFRQVKNNAKLGMKYDDLVPEYNQALDNKDVNRLFTLWEVEKDSAILPLHIGNCLAERGEYERAIRALEHGLSLAPGEPEFREVLVKCYEAVGNKMLAEHNKRISELLKFY